MKWITLILLLLLAAPPILADVVVTKTGKKILGKILGEENGKITVQTPSGKVEVPRDQVQSLEDEASLLKLLDLQIKVVSDSDADGFFRLGRWCGEKGLFDKQAEIFDWVVSIDFDHEGARKALGYVRDRSGAWVKMSRGGEGAGDSADFKKALRYFKDGKDDRAEELLDRIITDQPGFLEARYLRGEIYLSSGRFGKAGEEFQAMLKVDRNSTWAHYGIGHLNFLEKNYPKTLGSLKLAVETAERMESNTEKKAILAEIYFLMGRTHMSMGDKYFNEAESDFLRTVVLHRKHYRAWAELGIIYGDKGIMKKAQSAFSKSLLANSRYAKARFNWGVLLYRQGELQKAMAKLKSLVVTKKPYVPALLIYGRCYQRAGKNNSAEKYYKKYLKLGGDDPRGQEWLREVE